MSPEIIETTKALSPIFVALIGGIAGLVSGAVASLFAPWVHYFIERRKKSLEYRASKISEARALLNNSETMVQIKSHALWGFIDSHLSAQERAVAEQQSSIHVHLEGTDKLSSDEERKIGISKMLSRLEKEWELT